jgi:glycosyltransferase involved in cell wall biosynthesis
MRLLLLQDYLRSGGTERQSVLLANALAAAGHATALLTFRPGGALAATVAPAVRHYALQGFDTRLDWFAPGLRQAVADFAPQALLCMGRMANCFAPFLKRAFPEVALIGSMRTGKPLPWLYRLGLRRADHIIANSREAARVLEQQNGVPAEKISVVYNAPVFAPELGSAPGNSAVVPLPDFLRDLESGVPVLLCVAMFRPGKNQKALIEMAARLPAGRPWRLWFAGDGPTRAACEKLAAEKLSAERVRFFGFLADPRPLYHAASVGVLASGSESLPNFLVEAHLHGLPTVAFAVGGVAECGGIVVPQGDRERFLAESQALLFDAGHRAVESARVRAFASGCFSSEAQTSACINIFSRFVCP